MSVEIHPSSIVEKGAQLGTNVVVGPFSIVGPEVKLGDGCRLISHVRMSGDTTVGKNNVFYSFSSIGENPQDISYKGEPTRVEIGDHNTIREYVTIRKGTVKENGLTSVGSHNLIMCYVHLAHDVVLGNHNIIVNAVNMAGHVRIENNVTVGGGSGVIQFVTVGEGAYIGAYSTIDRDIPPFCTAYGNRIKLKGINIVGLRRRGHSRETITVLVDFFRTMEASALSPRAFVKNEKLASEFISDPLVKKMVDFIGRSEIGLAPFAK
ncbi:MAG: acyl-ACP--UDP-N-acetylglucosamine O-acyltransferase [Bacteriovoracales bacterium]|nr:acyl-ACP--UDP-N-acetylglucosamine O-acyltransferase [Bacteriovoracales bacterium]